MKATGTNVPEDTAAVPASRKERSDKRLQVHACETFDVRLKKKNSFVIHTSFRLVAPLSVSVKVPSAHSRR